MINIDRPLLSRSKQLIDRISTDQKSLLSTLNPTETGTLKNPDLDLQKSRNKYDLSEKYSLKNP